jgi:hypothetical protein
VTQGFYLFLTFGDSITDNKRGTKSTLTVPSGLDQPQTPKGQPIQQPFVEKDTIGKFEDLGWDTWKQTD